MKNKNKCKYKKKFSNMNKMEYNKDLLLKNTHLLYQSMRKLDHYLANLSNKMFK